MKEKPMIPEMKSKVWPHAMPVLEKLAEHVGMQVTMDELEALYPTLSDSRVRQAVRHIRGKLPDDWEIITVYAKGYKRGSYILRPASGVKFYSDEGGWLCSVAGFSAFGKTRAEALYKAAKTWYEYDTTR